MRLRIEDIDRTRCRPEYERAILEDLAWLGVIWDGPLVRQSERGTAYDAALESLASAGLAYRCFRTRREVAETMTRAPHGDEPVFLGFRLSRREEDRRLGDGEAFAWRLDVREAARRSGALTFREEGQGPGGETGLQEARPEAAGDIVLGRKDIGVAYHLAVVVDDAYQGVTTIIRGNDLFMATGVQRLLQVLLGLPEPRYRHHRLLVGVDGRRYAKRDRAETLLSIRERGITAAQLIEELGLD